MSLPSWNDDWQKSDPLRGKRGWACPHYADIGAVLLVLTMSFGLVLPVVARTREAESLVRRADEQRSRTLTPSVSEPRPQR
jgi:hypothetical protein